MAPLPIPKPEFTKSSLGEGHASAGRLEVSLSEDGDVLLSALGADGDYQFFKLSPRAAVGLAAALAVRAEAVLSDSDK